VAQETHDRIQNLLAPGSIEDRTRLVLANAIYFKAAWAKPYQKSQTSAQPFHLSTTEQVQVPLMHQTEDVNYTENADFQAVEVPYRGNKLSMVILLPRQVDACGQLEKRLTPALLASWLAELKRQQVEIFFPRFKLESSLNLKAPLSRLGMPIAFNDIAADFSGMDGTRSLHISDVFHKAWGEVNEEGTEAAAATGVVMIPTSLRLPAPTPVFRADHPFVFLIRHTGSGSVLFLGRLANPAS
jgi:serpin B